MKRLTGKWCVIKSVDVQHWCGENASVKWEGLPISGVASCINLRFIRRCQRESKILSLHSTLNGQLSFSANDGLEAECLLRSLSLMPPASYCNMFARDTFGRFLAVVLTISCRGRWGYGERLAFSTHLVGTIPAVTIIVRGWQSPNIEECFHRGKLIRSYQLFVCWMLQVVSLIRVN